MPPGASMRFDKEYSEWEQVIPEPLQWYCEHYPYLPEQCRPLEVIQEAGDLLYVPSGWWHSVLNLELSVAVTHNFVDDYNLKNVWEFFVGSASYDPVSRDLLLKWKNELEVIHALLIFLIF